MQKIILLLVLSSIMGCARSQSSHRPLPSAPVYSTITTQEIEYAKQHIPLLQPDMSDAEVFSTLGLSRFQIDIGIGGGPTNYHWMGYALLTNPRLGITIIRDYTAGASKLANVEFEGVSWKKRPGSDELLHGF
jgi:hypothetical protein